MKRNKSDPKTKEMCLAINKILKKYNGSILKTRGGYSIVCTSSTKNNYGSYTTEFFSPSEKCVGVSLIGDDSTSNPKKQPFNSL